MVNITEALDRISSYVDIENTMRRPLIGKCRRRNSENIIILLHFRPTGLPSNIVLTKFGGSYLLLNIVWT